ncbi:hypothetical protein [Croceicoccus naphthovorans]|uniref:Uncharacterized protein n=1 Tax=Croceicoccus naphthovorans TaxID=1348774 RepID=A0A0G3XKL7_9SPHN|nr:hypothetical protein [Croceicoccus naphthovorans]AKM11151.1 hypothetical protein AB433_16105 [Croceicoccus naphthovorans]MBB3989971.1 hypothetical protein [Croceicoccus naphthovorans]
MAQLDTASLAIAELREFAEFDPAEQRYIRRALDIGLSRADPYDRWARNSDEAASIRRQHLAYQELRSLRAHLPAMRSGDRMQDFMGRLIAVTAVDLAEGCLHGFAAYRFLYERLLGPEARPWLPAAFCAASALPQIVPERRKVLLHSISEAAACAPGWSKRRPGFYPDWIEDQSAEIH